MQSAQYLNFAASLAVDGDLQTVSCSTKEVNSWLSVEFELSGRVSFVHVAPGPDYQVAGSEALLSPFEVWISAVAGDVDSASAKRCGGPSRQAIGDSFAIDCRLAECNGCRFVTLMQTGSARYLYVAELYAYGIPAPPAPPLLPTPLWPPQRPPPPPGLPPSPPPLPAPPYFRLRQLVRLSAAMSSMESWSTRRNFYSYPAGNCIDDDLSTVCSTTVELGAWVSIQLAAGSLVGAIFIVADQTHPEQVLSPFDVWIGAAAGDADTPTSVRCGPETYVLPVAESAPFEVDCSGANPGRAGIGPVYVTIRSRRQDPAKICMFEIIAMARVGGCLSTCTHPLDGTPMSARPWDGADGRCALESCSGCERCLEGPPSWLFQRSSLTSDGSRRATPPPYEPLTSQPWPQISTSGAPMEVAVDAHDRATERPFTPFHLAVNLPLFLRDTTVASVIVPKLVAAGMTVWRWPGGAAGDTWCPTVSTDAYVDACFDRWPLLKPLGKYPTNPSFLSAATFIELCRVNSCTPIVQVRPLAPVIHVHVLCVQNTHSAPPHCPRSTQRSRCYTARARAQATSCS